MEGNSNLAICATFTIFAKVVELRCWVCLSIIEALLQTWDIFGINSLMRTRRLSRSMIDRTFGGVCGGLGAYLGISAWWVRLTFILFTVFTAGVSLVLYLVLWLVIPQQTISELKPGDPTRQLQVNVETLILLGLGVVVLGIIVLAVSLGVLQGERGDILLPFVILGLGVVLLAQQLRKQV
jgi:phage shock protein PspC (stress-responsive transcriptional regulator)